MHRGIPLLIFILFSPIVSSQSLLITHDRTFLSIEESWKTLQAENGVLRFHLLSGAYVSFPASEIDWEATRFFNQTRGVSSGAVVQSDTHTSPDRSIQSPQQSWERLISGILQKLRSQERQIQSLATTVRALEQAQRRVRRAEFSDFTPLVPFSDPLLSAGLSASAHAPAEKLSVDSRSEQVQSQ